MLKFISNYMYLLTCCNPISKHLMLKFIAFGCFAYVSASPISKHLMLKFILIRFLLSWCLTVISKHLMLKFITKWMWRLLERICIPKHLMLKFIHFRYSSMFFRFHFKTSYVEVYPYGLSIFTDSTEFQNILCWSLSVDQVAIICRSDRISKHLMLKFIQYRKGKGRNQNYFKTSYVEVYPTFSRYFYLLLSIFPFIFPDFYHFYQASAHILFPIQYLTNSPTLQYFLNIFLFFAW